MTEQHHDAHASEVAPEAEDAPGKEPVVDEQQLAKRADLIERLRIMNNWSRFGPK